MATFTERLRIIIDTQTDKAVSGFKNLQTSVRDADGFMGKLKAGAGALTDTLVSPAGLATAATAVVPALFGMAKKAEETGIEIGKLRDATGLSADAASRWVEVANDMGIGSDKVAGLIEKMTKNLGTSPAAFAKLGIEVRHAADGTVDMSATLLNAIDVLNKIKDPTERAAAAQKLFGKSWADAAELIKSGAPEVAKRLKEVSGGAIFTDQQINQQRQFRDAMANLADVGEHLALTIGKELTPALTQFAGVVSAGAPLLGGINLASETVHDLSANLAELTGSWDILTKKTDPGVKAIEASANVMGEAGAAADAYGVAVKELNDGLTAQEHAFRKLTAAQVDALQAQGAFDASHQVGNALQGAIGGTTIYNATFQVTQRLTDQEIINLIVAWQRRNGQIPRF